MPGKQQRPDNPKYDASYKSFFTHPRTVADTLRAVAGHLTRHLDFTTLERMPASFVTEHLGQRHTDMLWRVGTTGGGWVYILILLEFQSTVDRRMALRMTDYTTTIWMRLGKEDLGPRGEYPLILPIVIYNGSGAGLRRGMSRSPAPRARGTAWIPAPPTYLLIESGRRSGLGAAGKRAGDDRDVEAAPTARRWRSWGSLGDWLDAVGEPELAGAFVAWITQVLAQRFGPAGRELQHKLRTEEDGTMATLIERARKWGEERDQLWLQKGIERERQASIQRERELVVRQVTRRFGPGTAGQLLPVLERISEQEDIARVADAVVECENAEEFLRRVREG